MIARAGQSTDSRPQADRLDLRKFRHARALARTVARRQSIVLAAETRESGLQREMPSRRGARD